MWKKHRTEIFLFVLGILIFGYGASADELQQIYPTDISSEKSFTTHDNVRITFNGIFNDACYRVAGDFHAVDPSTKKILIKNYAYYDNESMCAQVITPYSNNVQIGTLNAGHYSVWTETEDGKEVELTTIQVQEER